MDNKLKLGLVLGAVAGVGATVLVSVPDVEGKIKNKTVTIKGDTATIVGETCFFEVTKQDGSKGIAAKAVGQVMTTENKVAISEPVEVMLAKEEEADVKAAISSVLKSWRKANKLEE